MFTPFDVLILIAFAMLISPKAENTIKQLRIYKALVWLVTAPFRHWPYVLGGVAVITVGYLIIRRGLYLYGEYGVAGVILIYIFAMFLYSYPKLLADVIKDWRERKQQPHNSDSLNQ